MPTRADFESAAQKLRAAAEQVGELSAAAQRVDASAILRGGSLGRQVPARIAACATTAMACRTSILHVESLCLDRAGLIATYEGELVLYDVAYIDYESRLHQYYRDYNLWYSSGGETPHPGSAPWAPTKPAAPPVWAEVRRP